MSRGDGLPGSRFATRPDVRGRHGMAATSHPLATDAAVATLRRGGSAVDAAIAANAVLGLTEPTGCGLGGDLFAIVWDPKTERLYGLDGSGRAPAALRPEDVRARGHARMPDRGPLSVTVPGCVDGWATLHARFRRLPWGTLFEDAIETAREGFAVTPVIAAHWAAGARVLREAPGFADTFLREGRAPVEGERFHNAALADTLTRLAVGGREEFYEGETARRLDAFCRRVGCPLAAEDLAQHTSTWVKPISTTYRGVDVWELPPAGQGLAVLQMLNLLEPYDLAARGFGTAETLHLLIEAKKLAFEDRARFYADPAFARVPTEHLLSKAYAAERAGLLDPERAAHAVPAGDLGPAGGDTVYLAVADEDGQMVSLIQSNYRGFGSGLCPDGLGFGLQNRGSQFHLDPAHANVLAPRKRPFHTIIPAFATRDGAPWLAFGLMGGDMQPQGHVQVLVNLLDFGLGLQEAGDAPRFHHGGSSEPSGGTMRDGGRVALEDGFAPDVAEALRRKGHRVEDAEGVFGGYQAIRCEGEGGGWVGASESRKDGYAAGY